MALVVPSAWQARMTWGQGIAHRHPPMNVFGLVAPPGLFLTQTIVNDLTDVIEGAWTTTAMNGRYIAPLAPQLLEVTDIRTATGPQFEAAIAATATGSTDQLPSEVAVVTTLTTALRGRSFRGRFYWPAPAESQNGADGLVSTTFADASEQILSAIGAFMEAITPEAGLGVISRLLSQINKVEGIETNRTWDTQRRRGLR